MVQISGFEVLFILGAMMLVGHLMGGLFKRLRMSELMGIIFAGILLKFIFSTLLKQEAYVEQVLSSFSVVVSIALGLEAFSIGSEMIVEEKDTKVRRRKLLLYQLFFVLIFTSLGYLIMRDVRFSLLIGAIVGATAPIALLESFDKYKKTGRVTRGISKMISFDNIIGIIYFFIVFSIVRKPFGTNNAITFLVAFKSLVGLVIAIGIGLLIGIILGFINNYYIKNIKNEEQKRSAYIFFILSILLMTVAGSKFLKNYSFFQEYYISEFVLTFVAGLMFSKVIGFKDNYEQAHAVHNFIPPILTVFFVIVGMELNLSHLIESLGIFLVVYIVILVVLKMLLSYIFLKRQDAKHSFINYAPFAVITKSSFEIYLAHLAMISTNNDRIFLVIILSILLFETLEPILISKTSINNIELL